MILGPRIAESMGKNLTGGGARQARGNMGWLSGGGTCILIMNDAVSAGEVSSIVSAPTQLRLRLGLHDNTNINLHARLFLVGYF